MYGIHTYIYHKHQPNVGKYTIHGSYGLYNSSKKLVQFPMLQAIPNPLVGGPQVEINFCGEIPMSELVGTNTQVGFFGRIYFSPDGGEFFLAFFWGGFWWNGEGLFLGVKKVTMTPAKVSSISFLALTATAEVWFGRSCVFFVGIPEIPDTRKTSKDLPKNIPKTRSQEVFFDV